MKYIVKPTIWEYNKYLHSIDKTRLYIYNTPQGRGYALRVTR